MYVVRVYVHVENISTKPSFPPIFEFQRLFLSPSFDFYKEKHLDFFSSIEPYDPGLQFQTTSVLYVF